MAYIIFGTLTGFIVAAIAVWKILEYIEDRNIAVGDDIKITYNRLHKSVIRGSMKAATKQWEEAEKMSKSDLFPDDVGEAYQIVAKVCRDDIVRIAKMAEKWNDEEPEIGKSSSNKKSGKSKS